jgi:hypothetical protein
MISRVVLVAALFATVSRVAIAAADPAEVDAVVAAVKANNSDMRSLCQSGPNGIRKAATEALMALVAEGKIKGNPQEVGGEAGQKIGQQCRGG